MLRLTAAALLFARKMSCKTVRQKLKKVRYGSKPRWQAGS